MFLNRIKVNLSFILIFLLAAFLLSINVNKPFIGHHDFNGALFSQIASNLTKYKISETKLALASGSGPQTSQSFEYYTHNVPLHPWLISVMFLFFSKGEWQARLLSVIFTLASLIFVYAIAGRLISKLAGLLASLFFVSSAMFIYFGSSVFAEPVGIFFCLGSFYFFILWQSSKKSSHFLILSFFTFLSLISVWASYFLTYILILYYLIFNKRKELKKIMFLVLLPVFVFLLFLFYIYLHTGSLFGGGIIEAFLFRSNISPHERSYFTLGNFVLEETHRLVAYYSKVTILLTISWFGLILIKITKREFQSRDFLLLALFLWGISYPLFFRNAAYIHDYFLIYLAPFLALSSAYFLIHIYSFIARLKPNFKTYILVLIFLVPFASFLQIKNFANALIASNANRDGYELGILLNKKTSYYDKILVLSGQFGAHFGIFTNYYANRNIIYQDTTLVELKEKNLDKKYDWVVFVKNRDTKEDVRDYLSQHYPEVTMDLFEIFKTKNER